LRIDRLVACQKNKRKNERCNANRHLLLLLFKQSNRCERPEWHSPEWEVFGAAPESLGGIKSDGCVAGRLE
jgi:hypothetical protein